MKKIYLNLSFFLATFILSYFLQNQPVMAQKKFRAKISKIASTQKNRETEIKKETDKVQYKRCRAANWVNGKIKAKLYDKDRVLIKPFTYAKLEMKGSTVGATFTLWGDAAKSALPAASYEIQKDPIRHGYYGLFVSYGSFVADGLKGLIMTKSQAMDVKHHGTRYMMTVEKEKARTTVFVEEGEVTVYANGDSLRLKPLEAAQALPGGVLIKLDLSTAGAQNYSRVIRTHHTELWRQFRPWWQSPWFYGSVAMGGATAGIIALATTQDDDNLAKGTIIVNW